MPERFNVNEYSDVHRVFVQAIMKKKGIFGSQEVFETLTAALKTFGFECPDRNTLKTQILEFMMTINRELRGIYVEIRRSMDERTGTTYYVLVNRLASPQTVAAFKHYSTNQLELFKAIMTAMFDEDDRSIEYIRALNMTKDLPKRMSMDDAEMFLNRLVAEKWLENVNGKLRLHVKAISELEPYLKSTFELSDCKICNNVIILKKNSQCASCETNAHSACVMKSQRRNCPNDQCRTPWHFDEQQQLPSQSTNSNSQRSSTSSQQTAAPKRAATPKQTATPQQASTSGSYRRVRMEESDSDS